MVERSEALRFARHHHRGVLATTRRDGRVALTPVVAGVDTDDRVVVSTRATAYKARNLARQPFASLCLFEDAFFGAYVQIEGPAELIPLPAAMEGLVDLYRQIAGEHPDWEAFREAMVGEARVLVRITPERVGPTQAG